MRLFSLLFVLFLSSCAYTTVHETVSDKYSATNEIMFLNNFPEKPHKQIAILEGFVVSNYGSAYKDLMAKGQSIGADALVLLPNDKPNRITAMAIKYQNPPP